MKTFTFFLLLLNLLLITPWADKILVVLDNKHLQKTHSQFFNLLKNASKGNTVEFAYSFGQQLIDLKYYDKLRYDHIVVMCTSEKEIESKLKTKEIISYFDDGGNVIVIGDVDTSFSFRKLFYAFGLELDDSGSLLKDHFSNLGKSDLIVTTNYETLAPFFTPSDQNLPLVYKGIGLNLVNYENYQLYNLIQAEPTTFSKNLKTESVIRAGSSITLAAGIQGLNNARALTFGSLHFFSNEVFARKDVGNKKVTKELLNWVFQKNGIIKVKSMSYHGVGTEHKETLFNVGEKIFFEAEIEEFNFEKSMWIPYLASDIRVELVMLDPWVRTSLINFNKKSTYLAQFHAPQKEGIYQFKIIYRKPGFNFIKEAERVTIRPYKHDEFERFLFVASPYFIGTFATIFSTFFFVLLYIYSSSAPTLGKDEKVKTA